LKRKKKRGDFNFLKKGILPEEVHARPPAKPLDLKGHGRRRVEKRTHKGEK